MQLRKIVKNRGHFPTDEAASKLLFLALRNIKKDWKMPQRTWKQAADQFAILFGERFANVSHQFYDAARHTKFLIRSIQKSIGSWGWQADGSMAHFL